MDIKKSLSGLKIDLTSIQDENLREMVLLLLNAVEYISKENEELRKKNQALSDEVNRLKGEQGRPKIRPQKPDKDTQDHSSEKERAGTESKEEKSSRSKPKKGELKIDRVERCEIATDKLPSDAVFKGYESVVIQDIKITTDNVRFERATYYSASTGKTYRAPLPSGYQGQFGPTIKALVLDLYQNGGMTEPALRRFFETHGVFISSGTISSIITDTIALFHQEKSDIVESGLGSTDYHHLDDTASRVNGKNQHAHILCNPFFTAYFTLPFRDRLAAIEVLSNGKLSFCVNEKTYKLMEELGLSEKRLNEFKALNLDPSLMTEQEINAAIKLIFPKAHRHQSSKKIIREAAAIIAYQQNYGKAKILMTDGALQFQRITQYQALCWVHEGRHYKKLNPILKLHREALELFRSEFWAYYRRLLVYKKSPTKQDATLLAKDFDVLFSRKTGYQDLDKRIASTCLDKAKLLLVLKFPYIPLHNNPAEGGARIQARKRDISFQTKNAKGTKAKDTLMTLIETAKKLGVNTFRYIYDRLSGQLEMPSLASLICQKATASNLA